MRTLALSALVLVAACTDPAGDTVTCKVVDGDILPAIASGPRATRYVPLVTGATWTYRFTATLETTTQTVTVMAPEAIDGVMQFPVLTEKAYGVKTTTWLEDRGQQVVRHRELSIDGDGDKFGDETWEPGRPLLDENAAHLDAGSSYTTHFKDIVIDTGGTYQDCKTDQFEVVSTDDTVTVPAGTFQALKVSRTDNGSTIWYARGVGRVKQTGATTTYELLDYAIP
jgi:hypothetical protein